MIFISYAREDLSLAVQLEAELQGEGWVTWRDPPRVQGDPFWRQSLCRSLEMCRAMIILWSTRAAMSPWIEHEIRGFNGQRAFVLLDDTPPLRYLSGASLHPAEVPRWLNRVARREEPIPPPAQNRDGSALQTIAQTRLSLVAEANRSLEEFKNRIGRNRVESLEQTANGEWRLTDDSRLRTVPPLARSLYGARRTLLLSTSPITNLQYGRFVEAAGWLEPSSWDVAAFRDPDAPVVGVTWFDAKAYAAWAGADLPSQVDWFAAACSGDQEAEFATVDGILTHETAYFLEPLGQGAPVDPRRYPANPAGFYGMTGNTWDWCNDSWGPHRVIRGGGYMDAPLFCRTSARYRNSPLDRDCCVGFRLRLEIKSLTI